jgi:hypothetical protein
MMTAALLGALPGCPRPAPSGPAAALGCPDPPNCTLTNGTGVYTAEDGFAGFQPSLLMITHFINSGSSVQFTGRYFNPTAKLWHVLDGVGQVVVATYPSPERGLLQVTSVSADATVPTWTLQDPTTHEVITVTGDAVRQLKLYVSFSALRQGESYLIDFDGPPIAHRETRTRPISAFHMRWTPVAAGGTPTAAAPTSYCTDAAGAPDSVVFQQGVDVDPITGAVKDRARSSNVVTLSCYLGALATVYRWGYDYLGAAPFYFDAGIQMKRASYCGDAGRYTVAGTPIEIADDQRINHDATDRLEAWWAPTGAVCLNPQNMRHPEKGFTGSCKGKPLPACQGPPPASPWLLDGRAP